MCKKNKKEEKKIEIIKDIIRLEFKTDSGKVNFFFAVILGLLCITLTKKEWILAAIHLIGSFALEIWGKSSSSIVYESTNNIVIFLLFILVIVICIFTIREMEKSIARANGECVDNDQND